MKIKCLKGVCLLGSVYANAAEPTQLSQRSTRDPRLIT